MDPKRLLDQVATRDYYRLLRRLKRLGPNPPEAPLQSLKEAIERSRAWVERRRGLLPEITYPDLPIVAKREAILEALREHQVVIVCGETGSGKTTQLPKLCLEAGRGIRGMIGHTQPRRIAARSLAQRIAEELKVSLGRQVGYKVRFQDETSPETLVKVMTDGILLAEIQGDRLLSQYDTLILDEAHERSLNIDFLLGYLKGLLSKRPDLKLIVTSATLDPEKFSRHFGGAPIIEIPGRSYPVEIRYRPPEEEGDLFQAIANAVEELLIEEHHDVLVFLSGEREIREAAEALRKRHGEGQYEILPLYARLSSGEQQRVFRPGRLPRVVLATNVAETSLTVPRIRGVVDTGLARISRYSPRSKIQRLPIEPISKASAKQRAGRCGRIAPGICIRLYSEEDFKLRPEFTEPELLRTNLSAVILQMKALRLGEVSRFPFPDPPDPRQIRAGLRLLQELGALDERGELTEIGRLLARFPIDPQLARIIVEARKEQCLSEAIVIAAALSIQDPRERPAERAEEADSKQAKWQDRCSDFLAFLKLWQSFREARRGLSGNRLRKFCREHFLSYRRMLEWEDLVAQLREIVRSELGWRLNQLPAQYDQLHRAILSGLITHVGFREERFRYAGCRGLKFYLFPGSGLFKEKPKWIVAAELVETSRLYARTCAEIDPAWVEQIAPHLLKRNVFEPHWDREARRVFAFERLSLYGLPVVPRRRVAYERIDPKGARELFIQKALVEMEADLPLPFFRHNRALLEELALLREKARRDDLLLDGGWLYSFYDERIPAEVASGDALERWWRWAPPADQERLFLKREELLASLPIDPKAFPDRWPLRPALELRYRFEPGSEEDGVSLLVPLEHLETLSQGEAEWLVPGLLYEKLLFLLKGLPKRFRKPLVPIPETARRLLEELKWGEGDFHRAVSRALLRIAGLELPPELLAEVALPPYLRLNFKVLDGSGRLLLQGRNLERLRAKLRLRAKEAFQKRTEGAADPLLKRGLRSWPVDHLPEKHALESSGESLPGYLALVDEGETVGTALFPSEAEAREAHVRGLLRLLRLALTREVRRLKRENPFSQEEVLLYARLPDHPYLPRAIPGDELLEAWLSLTLKEAFLGEQDPWTVRKREAFEVLLEGGRSRLYPLALEWRERIGGMLGSFKELLQLRQSRPHLDRFPSGADVDDHQKTLLFRGFLWTTPPERLRDYPRYLEGLRLRLERLQFELAKDEARLAKIAPFWEAYWRRVKEKGLPFERDPFRWQLEEFRIFLFAQRLKTAYPISEKRIARAWEAYCAA